ncbi:hypothetical protein GWI33_006347 [Rhynchophorus ferrugineus]|uniref:Uncharacterized protein n=1 Tax=Rhynchophorus ferrugineus TaxID=354439 RepID=A0A834MFJ8_RHYFE|nr:hypothetical protein GWI33_006347 [Rhynchophorus ferrugineus]
MIPLSPPTTSTIPHHVSPPTDPFPRGAPPSGGRSLRPIVAATCVVSTNDLYSVDVANLAIRFAVRSEEGKAAYSGNPAPSRLTARSRPAFGPAHSSTPPHRPVAIGRCSPNVVVSASIDQVWACEGASREIARTMEEWRP